MDAGSMIDGRYEIVRELGAGGMGAVYEATQVKLRKRVALKVMRPDRAHRNDGGNSLKRFLREARVASSVTHRNVVAIIDFGDLDDGATYYVMELLQGRDLSSLLKAEGKLPWPRVRGFLRQVLGALDAAHAQGIIHRDIKPANIMLLDEADEWGKDWIKVLDFGIARLQEADEESQALTGTSELLGTAPYMGPELARGGQADERTDLYAVGIVAYQLLTGVLPFTAVNTFQVLFRHINDAPTLLRELDPSIPAAVEAFVLRALAKDPDDRYQSAAEMAEIMDALGDKPSKVPPAIVPKPSWFTAPHPQIGFARPTSTSFAPSGTTHTDRSLGRRIGPQPSEAEGMSGSADTVGAAQPRWLIPAGLVLVAGLAGLVIWLALRGPPETSPVVPAAAVGEPKAEPEPEPKAEPGLVGGSSSGGSEETSTAAAPAASSGTTGGEGEPDGGDESGTEEAAVQERAAPVKCRSRACLDKQAERKLHKAVKSRCRSLGSGETVTVKFTIGSEGQVLMPRALAPHDGTALGKCVVEAVVLGTFPRPDKLTSKFMKFKP